jgi:hypothetical protein
MTLSSSRKWLIYWMYFTVAMHFVSGVFLAWFSHGEALEGYHQTVLQHFQASGSAAHELTIWWLSLFGASLQNLALLMGVLIYLGSQKSAAYIWGWMLVGLLIWAPQDMFISLQVDLWLHVWIDAAALVMLVPPLAILWHIDRQA